MSKRLAFLFVLAGGLLFGPLPLALLFPCEHLLLLILILILLARPFFLLALFRRSFFDDRSDCFLQRRQGYADGFSPLGHEEFALDLGLVRKPFSLSHDAAKLFVVAGSWSWEIDNDVVIGLGHREPRVSSPLSCRCGSALSQAST